MARVLKFILCLILPLIVGGISGFMTLKEIPTWYATLHKPSFNPPNYLFGPVWTTLYILMGISFYIAINKESANRRKAVGVFIIQLSLNFFWSIIFFNMHKIGLALTDILLLWLCIAGMIVIFYKINKVSGILQIPYLLWVTFATVLNTSIFLLN